MADIKWVLSTNIPSDWEPKVPTRATEHSVGYDFVAPYDFVIMPKDKVLIDTGVRCDFPEGLWLGIYGRSSNYKKGLMNTLGVGVIDADYFQTGNTIKVALTNTTNKFIDIKKGDGIAQGIFHHVVIGDDVVDVKRIGGFGSTLS